MLELDSEKWRTFEGGYRILYDASVPLRKLESCSVPDEKIIQELWNELHHQGDVGVASYAALPVLYRIFRERNWIDFNLPAIAAIIERSREERNNPEVPDWLAPYYFESLRAISHYCLDRIRPEDKHLTRAFLLLTCALAGDFNTFELLDLVGVGEENAAIEKYLSDG
jgi:hypothetical protein